MTEEHLSRSDIIEEAEKNSLRLKERIRLLILYKKIVTGIGVEFDRLRKYVPGDEARLIDWNSLARTGKLYTKVFEEDRLLNVVIIQDFSESMSVGTTEILKQDYASIVSTTLAKTALEAGDKVGFVAFADDIKETKSPTVSEEVPYAIAGESEKKGVFEGEADWEKLSRHVIPRYGEETFIFVISDFVDDLEGAEKFLVQASEKFRGVFTVMVRDPLDSKIPEGAGQVYLGSPGDGEKMLVDTDEIRGKYNEKARAQEERIRDRTHSLQGEFMITHTDEDFTKSLSTYLDERQK